MFISKRARQSCFWLHRLILGGRGQPLRPSTSILQNTPPKAPSSILLKHCAKLALLVVCAFCIRAEAQDFSQQTQPAPEAALIQQVNDALAAGDFPAALKLLTTLNAQTPNNAEVLYDLGLTGESLAANSEDGKTKNDPESYYRQSIAANPLFPLSRIALFLLLARAGHSAEAHTELLNATAIPDIDPALKARAYRALARLDLNGVQSGVDSQHSMAANPTAAAAELLEALKLTPEQPDDILLSAEIAEAANDLPTAEQAYRRALALTPQDPAAVGALTHILLAEHHPAEAEALLAPALAAHPGDPTLTAQLAAAYLASGDSAKVAHAAPLLETLHRAHPQDVNVARLLARVYVETGHPEQADPLYAEIISGQPQNGRPVDPTLLTDRAEALLRLHRPAEAESLLKQAVANPSAFPTSADFADAATQLAFAAAGIDDPKEVLHALTLRSTVLPSSPATLFLQATANDTLHQSNTAVDLYKQFLAAARGDYPEQESQARQRLAALQQKK